MGYETDPAASEQPRLDTGRELEQIKKNGTALLRIAYDYTAS
jgi:hypothetical protein